ncbi:CHAT domain-containing protein [Spelaeicoccus albus]|uniref:CHAT domain-containing protein n=1 Tax=Spelaeicoccus albus TaxID=1280376 RepID=A0A7Z0IHD4_9MICO|nr:CHAT domain-containing protein [Spelaeicoccus albus]NYI67492.1 CHAT domain-containing protein [Spelaeicoccus albus]
MTRSDQIKSEIGRLDGSIAALRKELARQQKKADDAAAKARHERDRAHKTKSDSTKRSAMATAERKDKEASTGMKKVGDISVKIAAKEKSVNAKRTSLAAAERSEQRTKDHEDDRRRRKEKSHAQEIARLSHPPARVRFVEVQPPDPEPLRVLYLTANPHATETTVEHPDGTVETNGVWLRVDQEVRKVNQALKKSKFRDLVTVEHLPAATGQDLMDGLNDHRPHVVHFSGHASELGVLLEDDEGSRDGNGMEFALLARVLGATDEPPRLVVLNACESLEGAGDLLRTVPTIIGMSESISDLAAMNFATQFYAAIASAQSVASAVEQAKTQMQMAMLEDFDLPEIRTREGVDGHSLVLVNPSE